jgi:hypothetical protein
MKRRVIYFLFFIDTFITFLNIFFIIYAQKANSSKTSEISK